MQVHGGQYVRVIRDHVEMFDTSSCDGDTHSFYSVKAAIGWLAIREEIVKCAANRFARNSNGRESVA